MSYQDDESVFEHLEGLGLGIPLVLVGLIVTVGNIWLGATLGIPMILLGILVPAVMTNNAKQESDRQRLRRRPEHSPSDGYTISSKHLRKRRH